MSDKPSWSDMKSVDLTDLKPDCGPQDTRQSAATRLRQWARQLRDKAHRLEHLADYLENTPREIDQAVWDLVCDAERTHR